MSVDKEGINCACQTPVTLSLVLHSDTAIRLFSTLQLVPALVGVRTTKCRWVPTDFATWS